MSYWKDLTKKDIIGKLKPFFMSGELYIDRNDLKIKKRMEVVLVNNPWIFIKQPDWLNCTMWSKIYFKQLGIIHSSCFNCFKVVVRPETVEELFNIRDIMLDLDLPSKCGIEVRNYVGALYGAYFYCNGLDRGKEVYELVKNIMTKEIRPNLSIILKRGCTEFELLHGDSRNYEQKEQDKELEELFESNADIPIRIIPQPDIVKTHIERLWLAWAFDKGDKTYLKYNDGEKFVTQPTTYHEIKDD